MNLEENLDIPYVPSSNRKIETMIELANLNGNELVADLGSGEGALVINFAKQGCRVDGYEIHSGRVEKARQKIKDYGLGSRAKIYHKSFWDADVSKYDIVLLYGITSIMERLEAKLQKELKAGAKVISNTFAFPVWQPVAEKDSVYLYQKTDDKNQTNI